MNYANYTNMHPQSFFYMNSHELIHEKFVIINIKDVRECPSLNSRNS